MMTLPRTYRIASLALLKLIPQSALFPLQTTSSPVRIYFLPSIFSIIHTFSFLAYVSACSTVDGLPSITLNTNVGASQSTPNTATLPGGAGTSTANVPATTPSGSQVIIGPSSTASAPSLASSVGSTSTATGSTGGLPLKSSAASAFPSAIILHWTVALLGLAAGNILVFWEISAYITFLI